MKINYKPVKEIILTSTPSLGGILDESVSATMKISLHKVSFRKVSSKTKEELSSWYYQTTSNNLTKKFDELCKALDKEIYKEHGFLLVMNEEQFEIKIIFDDGSHIEYERDGNFTSNELEYVSSKFKEFVPEDEDYPRILD